MTLMNSLPSVASSVAAHTLELFERAGPVLLEQAGERAVRQQLAAGLAARAVVGLVVGVANAQHFGAAARARLAVPPVHGHGGAKCRHSFRETAAGFLSQSLGPIPERLPGGFVEARDLLAGQPAGECGGRELGNVQYLIGIRVADAAHEMRIGERALERVVLGREARRELFEAGLKHLEPARVEAGELLRACHHVNRGPLARSRLAERQAAGIEIERRHVPAARRKLLRWRACSRPVPPVQPPGNHQVQHQPVIPVETHRDALPDSPQALHSFPFQLLNRRSGSPQQIRSRQAHALELVIENAPLKRLDVDDNIRQFGHLKS
ncbi:hypothetical protein SBA2_270086 [Acidobacteriia bacterium SbA2]|nr:hypothetical protein SBA2_270086 [Acidobacteriia bacterium SbA2]